MSALPIKARVIILGENFKSDLLKVLPTFEDNANLNLEILFNHLKRDILSLARHCNNPQNREINFLYTLRLIDIINQTLFEASADFAFSVIEKWPFFSQETREEFLLYSNTSGDALSYFFSYDYINKKESCGVTRENLFSKLDILVSEVIRRLLFDGSAKEGINASQHDFISELILKSKKGDVVTIQQMKENIITKISSLMPEDVFFDLIKNYDLANAVTDQISMSKFVKVNEFLKIKRESINSIFDNIQIIDSIIDLVNAELTLAKMIKEYSLFLYQALLLVDTYFSRDLLEFAIVDQRFEQSGAYKSQSNIDLEVSILDLKNELKHQGGVIVSNLEKINFQLEDIGADLKKTNSTLLRVLDAVSSLEETMYTQIMGLRNDLSTSIGRLDSRLERNLKSISSNVNTGNIINFIQTLQIRNIRKSLN